ncbi:hypothetical protein EP47_02550 [Legionella norrlandica]|uniref:Uncharacterized protein n=1 Tax=Legionella norrlandica TaxID=1498499 RepID=A0A0A2SPK1_9GAMM|nr:hypothetical protein [Legionella norrlandica]KGP62682.1 hypothetical protein EP47_02550 [Legionella norrlandica]
MVVNKKHFEMAVFNALADEIHCADMFLEGVNHYDDLNKQLITWEEFYAGVDEYCGLIQQPRKPSEFIKSLQDQLLKIIYRGSKRKLLILVVWPLMLLFCMLWRI